MVDASALSDDELNKVIETGEEPEAAPETPEEPQVPEALETPEEPQEPEERPSNRLLERSQRLLEKFGPPAVRRPEPTGIDYAKELEAEPEIVQTLENDRRAVSDEAFRQGISQAEVISWRNSLKLEAPTVEEKFPFLNPKDTENFRPATADALSRKYLRFIGYDPGNPQNGIPESVQIPDVSYREFIEAEVEFADALAERKNVESSKNIARQTAQTGLRPDGSSAKRLNLNQSEKDMTIEELYAAIGQTPPKKSIGS